MRIYTGVGGRCLLQGVSHLKNVRVYSTPMYVYSPCDPSSHAIPFCYLTSMYIFTLEHHTPPAVLLLVRICLLAYIYLFVCNCLFLYVRPPWVYPPSCVNPPPRVNLLNSLCVSCCYHKTRKRKNSLHTASYTLNSNPDLYPPPHVPASLFNVYPYFWWVGRSLILQQRKDLDV